MFSQIFVFILTPLCQSPRKATLTKIDILGKQKMGFQNDFAEKYIPKQSWLEFAWLFLETCSEHCLWKAVFDTLLGELVEDDFGNIFALNCFVLHNIA